MRAGLALALYALFTFLVLQAENRPVKHITPVVAVTVWETHTAEK